MSGGPDFFLVFLCVGNREFYEVFDPLESEDSVSLIVGGQVGTFTRRQLIDRALTLRAAQTYYDAAELDGSISWQSR